MTLFYEKPSGKGRFSPFLSYQVLKYIGLLLIGISQFVMIREVYAYVFPNSGFVIPDNFASLLKSLSVVGTPLVMISLFANFMYNRQNIKYLFYSFRKYPFHLNTFFLRITSFRNRLCISNIWTPRF